MIVTIVRTKNTAHMFSADEVHRVVRLAVKVLGNNSNINFLDTSMVEDMSCLFNDYRTIFFNGNISEWDTHNVKSTRSMFLHSRFNGDISKWDMSGVMDMNFMFKNSLFGQDISSWKINPEASYIGVFTKSHISRKKSYWPKAISSNYYK